MQLRKIDDDEIQEEQERFIGGFFIWPKGGEFHSYIASIPT